MSDTYTLYNGAVRLEFDDGRHRYTVNGEWVPSVTTALNIISKPALKGWAAKMAAEYVAAHLEPGIPLDEVQIKALCKEAKDAHRKVAQDAADIGTLAHEWIEKYITGMLYREKIPRRPRNKQVQAAVDAFLEWEEEHRVIYTQTERKVYSRMHNYAGTVDIIATVDGETCIVDLKTSNGIWDEYLLQVAAYAAAYTEETSEAIDRLWILRIPKDGSRFDAEVYGNSNGFFLTFMAALNLYNGMKQIKALRK